MQRPAFPIVERAMKNRARAATSETIAWKKGSLRRDEFLTLQVCTATINASPSKRTLKRRSARPRRLAWPRTSPFHGGNTGSNPVGDANNPV